MNFKSDYQANKIYNYKTYSEDGSKVLMERSIKFLFSYAQSYQYLIYQHFLSKNIQSFKDYKGDIFGNYIQVDKFKKKINDSRCRYILAEEVITYYTVTGKVHHQEKKVIGYDKSIDRLPSGKINMNFRSGFTYRTLYKQRDNNNICFYKGGAMVNVPTEKEFVSYKYGRKVKMVDSLTIK